MTLIDKKRVVAKIERLMDETTDEDNYFYSAKAEAQYNILLILKNSIDYIDTIEAKEVDLEKEVVNWWNAHYSSKAYTFEGYSGHYLENSTVIDIAKHFFELGLKAQKGEEA